MPLSKQALLVENNTNFPNNNTGFITPALLREFNADMIDAMQLTQSMSEYAVLSGSNSFIGNQTITGDLNVTGVISASVLHVQYETASVIFSTGSNQLGDELTDVQTLSGSVKIQGQLLINGIPLSSGSATIDTGSLVTTSSFNAYTSSNNQRVTALETNSASVNISISNLNTTTASLNTSVSALNQFTQSQNALNGTFATTGSNTFTGNQIIDRASKLYTNGVYWTDMTAGFNNLEIINQGGGNLDFASLNGGRMRVVNTPLQLTGSVLSSNSDISTSANVYGANLTASAIPAGTISSSAQISALGFVSSSITASSLITASFSGNTLTFTKGDASTFGVVIPDVSGSTINTGSFATTASFNSYTQSNDQRVSSLEVNSASVNTSITNINTTTASLNSSISQLNVSSASQQISIDALNTNSASVNTSITNINSATASLFTSASLALVTASAAGSTITFTKGDNTQFNVTLDTGSATSATTIFEVVYTGENITKGDPLYISGSQGANPKVFKADAADPNKMPVTFISNETIGVNNTTNAIVLGLIEGIDLTGYTAGQTIYVAEGTGGYSTSLPSGSNSITQLLGVITKGGSGGKGLVLNPGPAQLPGLDTGKMWVGNGNNQPIEITSASFVNTASFNSYTSSTDSRLTNIESTTASLLIETENLELFSASALVSISNLNQSSASQQVSINALNAATASYVTETESGSFLITASFSGNTLTFTKGDNSTFGVVIPDVSGSTFDTGSLVTTSSFNSYTSSNDQKVNSLINATGSYATTGSNTFTGNNTFNDNVYITASRELFFGNQSSIRRDLSGTTVFDTYGGYQKRNYTSGEVYLWQYANAQLTILNEGGNIIKISGSATSIQDVDFIPFSASLNSRILAITGSSIDTGSFATTGSNSFNGSQTITGSITTTQDITISGVKFGFGNPAGTSSIAIGNSNTLQNNTDDNNIAIGNAALQQNTTGERNIGIGTESLKNITGNSSYNTAMGGYALSSATSSTNTFALGYAAMENAVDSNENIAIGVAALYRKKANSNRNTAIGSNALREHFDGDSNEGQNMAFGLDAMRYVTSGSANTAIGAAALRDAGRANENVFIGWISGINASGSIDQNVVIGGRAAQKIAGNSNTIIGHNAGTDMVNGGANTFIGQGAGAAIITGSSNTLIGRSLSGVDNWSNVIAISDGTGAIKTKFQSNIWEFTGSVDIQNTLTASLQQGFTYVGDANGRTTLVATSSFGGGGSIDTGSFATTGSNVFTGDQTLVDAAGNSITLSDVSGSLMLVAKTFTSASTHFTASLGNQVNLIFKFNNNTADTIISGSGNIFTNPTAPVAGFKRYIGGNASIFAGPASVPQISGSMQFSPSMNQNYIAGGMNMRGPVSSSQWTISQNNIMGTVLIGTAAATHAQGITSGLAFTQNNIAGTVAIVANQTSFTGLQTAFSQNSVGGTVNLTLNQSAAQLTNNIINDGNFSFTNNYFSQSAGLGQVTVNRNNFAGFANQIIVTGSQPAGTTNAASYNDNFMGGSSNILFADASTARVSGTTAYHSAARNIIYGQNLIVTASSAGNDTTGLGSAFFGRWNSVTGNSDLTAETIFAVGTGQGTASRKTGFLIDSGSNTFVEGTLNVSGTLFLNGVSISGSGGGTIPEGTVSSSAQILAYNIFATTGSNSFNGNQTITGSVNIKGNTTFTSVGNNTTNIILGANALGNATGANNSVAIGENALLNTTSGANNFALGNQAMYSNTTGYQNVAMGVGALYNNTTGFLNVAIGNDAMISCGTASFQNVAIGSNALKVASGNNNFGLGANALENNTGNANIALGQEAGRFHSGSSNVLVGQRAGQYLTGSANTIIGGFESTAGTSFDNNIVLADGVGNVRARYNSGEWQFPNTINVTGSVSISNVLQLAQLSPLPSGVDGQMAVSASNLYFYSGSAWNKIAFG